MLKNLGLCGKKDAQTRLEQFKKPQIVMYLLKLSAESLKREKIQTTK